jgi:predicted thioesterase
MKATLSPGITGQVQHRVHTEHLVSFQDPEGPPVLSSPWLLFMLEHAAWEAMRPHLEAPEQSVGIGFDFKHLAPTPAGAVVTARAIAKQCRGRIVTFEVEAHDGHEVVAQGTHVRAVIKPEEFKQKLAEKRMT